MLENFKERREDEGRGDGGERREDEGRGDGGERGKMERRGDAGQDRSRGQHRTGQDRSEERKKVHFCESAEEGKDNKQGREERRKVEHPHDKREGVEDECVLVGQTEADEESAQPFLAHSVQTS
eukprot:763778-Hanusia_phi.AAC.18